MMRTNQVGFSLIELLVTMGIASIGTITAMQFLSMTTTTSVAWEKLMDIKIENLTLGQFFKLTAVRYGNILNRQPVFDEYKAATDAGYLTTRIILGDQTNVMQTLEFANVCKPTPTNVAWMNQNSNNFQIPANHRQLSNSVQGDGFKHCNDSCPTGQRPVIEIRKRSRIDSALGTFVALPGATIATPLLQYVPDLNHPDYWGGVVCAFPIQRESNVVWAVTFAIATIHGTKLSREVKWSAQTHYVNATSCPGLKNDLTNQFATVLPTCP